MIIIFALLSLIFPAQVDEPTLSVAWDGKPVVATDDLVEIQITFASPSQVILNQANLLPLTLQNMCLESISSNITISSTGDNFRITWDIAMRPLEIGSATIEEIQLELSRAGNQPQLLTWPEITLQVEKPFRLLDYWPAYLSILIFALAGGSYLYWRQKKEESDNTSISHQNAQRQKIAKEIDHYKVRAQWAKVVEKAMQGIHHEMFPSQAFARLNTEQLESLSEEHPEFSATYRLWEETRYGGFEPGKQEANFATKIYRQISSDKQRKENK